MAQRAGQGRPGICVVWGRDAPWLRVAGGEAEPLAAQIGLYLAILRTLHPLFSVKAAAHIQCLSNFKGLGFRI